MLASQPLPVLERLLVAGLGSLLRLCRVAALARRYLFSSTECSFELFTKECQKLALSCVSV